MRLSNPLQALVDSKIGIVLSTTMHTLGAIGLLGGLVGYVAWHRHIQRGHHHPQVLATSTFLLYFSILVNLIGGFMRTYETGHPHLTDFGSSGWVRAITIKHVFLFAGMGAGIYLMERVAPRHLKAFKAGTFADQSLVGHQLGVFTVALGIIVAAVLGAVSSILPVDATPIDDMDDGPFVDAYHNATGQLLGTPLAPAVFSSTFEVPANRTDLAVLLTWTPVQSNVQIELVDPAGRRQIVEPGAGGRLENSLGEIPAPGRWTYRITSPDAVINAQWALVLHMPASGTHGHT